MMIEIILAAATMALAGSEWGWSGPGEPYVQFAVAGRVSGHGGCNRFSGSYAQSQDELRIGPLMATRMACEPALMESETKFFAMLEATRRIEATHLKLVLKDASGNVLGTLRRRDWD